MFRNRRPQPDTARERSEHFDLSALATQRRQQQAATQAAAMAQVPPAVHQLVANARSATPDPLVALLDRPLPAKLPPVELVQAHEVALAELLTHAARADGAARRAAF